jgi:hypothetical protein
MPISLNNLTEEETKFIIFAIKNVIWQSDMQLKVSLGDVEKDMVEQNKKEAHDLLVKISAYGNIPINQSFKQA